ncbi:ASC domain containing protein [Asbolus verrucosus]|uniref:ASC domain containing protein n=1 Tax=Asbolus verrucosus TaxID=1661398 RepID=A0A482V6J2_ASBVE|nr:ASC domain containing protein [Asbolus verrucosus]
MSRLTVYFKVNHFITSERQELYGPIDFVANFGGLLGLFTATSNNIVPPPVYVDSSILEKIAQFSKGKKIWWLTVFGLVLSCCSLMIYKIYEKYETSPVIVTFATKETPIYKIPFPVVTICPETKSVEKKFDFTKVTQKTMNNEPLSTSEDKYLHYISLLCDYRKNFTSQWINDTYANDFKDVLDEIRMKGHL